MHQVIKQSPVHMHLNAFVFWQTLTESSESKLMSVLHFYGYLLHGPQEGMYLYATNTILFFFPHHKHCVIQICILHGRLKTVNFHLHFQPLYSLLCLLLQYNTFLMGVRIVFELPTIDIHFFYAMTNNTISPYRILLLS